ncbi:hypothetical protein Tco_0768430 [Tanacetum coccineum]
MEIDTTPSSPTLMMSAAVILDGEEREVCTPGTQAVEEAFIMANYSQLEPLMRRRMKELGMQGIVTHLNYSNEDVDEEREMGAPPEFQLQPLRETEGQTMQGIPSLFAAHLQET